MIQAVTSMYEIFAMQEPNLQVFSKPLSEEDRNALQPVRHTDYDFVFGLSFVIKDMSTYEDLELPSSIARWVQEANNNKESGNSDD